MGRASGHLCQGLALENAGLGVLGAGVVPLA